MNIILISLALLNALAINASSTPAAAATTQPAATNANQTVKGSQQGNSKAPKSWRTDKDKSKNRSQRSGRGKQYQNAVICPFAYTSSDDKSIMIDTLTIIPNDQTPNASSSRTPKAVRVRASYKGAHVGFGGMAATDTQCTINKSSGKWQKSAKDAAINEKPTRQKPTPTADATQPVVAKTPIVTVSITINGKTNGADLKQALLATKILPTAVAIAVIPTAPAAATTSKTQQPAPAAAPTPTSPARKA